MGLSKNIIINLNEKAEIDWNNYLTKEEMKEFLSKDDKVESAENIIYSDNFKDRYKKFHNKLQAKYKNSWTKPELVQDLANFYYKGHLMEKVDDKSKNALELWKSQMNKKDTQQLTDYLFNKLYKELDKDLTYDQYNILLQKINYIENNLGISSKRGRKLH